MRKSTGNCCCWPRRSPEFCTAWSKIYLPESRNNPSLSAKKERETRRERESALRTCFFFLFLFPLLFLKPLAVFPFQDLDLYKKSQEFHLHCKKILGAVRSDKYVNDQLSRASYSIVLNIAEGSAKTSNADRRNYFTTARGSLFECVAILDLLLLEQAIREEVFRELLLLAEEISRILYRMVKNLSA